MNIREEFNTLVEQFKKDYPVQDYESQNYYANWLAQTYYFVKHSTPLLGYAIPHLNTEELKNHFEKHIGEESRHDRLLVKDLERMGLTPKDFQEYSATQAFYQSQYYRITFEGGTSLLGYILFLEGIAVHWAKDIHEQMKGKYKNSMLFLKVHAEEDVQHLESAFKTILSLSEAEQAAICRNLHYSAEIYREILNTAKRADKKAA